MKRVLPVFLTFVCLFLFANPIFAQTPEPNSDDIEAGDDAAVGRVVRSRAPASSTSPPRFCASAMPNAAATPIAGAPRTIMSLIALATDAASRHSTHFSSVGNSRWSSNCTESPVQRSGVTRTPFAVGITSIYYAAPVEDRRFAPVRTGRNACPPHRHGGSP